MAASGTNLMPVITGVHSGFPQLLRAADFDPTAIDGGALSIADGGGDLRIYTDATKTTRLPIDVVRFVTGGTPNIEVHFRHPSAYTNAPYFIERSATESVQPAEWEAYGRDAVYTNDDRVYHLKDSASTVVDATGTDDGTMDGTASYDSDPPFGSTNVDFLFTSNVIGISDPFAGASRAAVRAWYRNPDDASKGLTGAWLGGDTNMSTMLFTGSNDSLNFRVRTSSVVTASSSAKVQDGSWHHAAGLYDGSSVKTLIDGVVDGSAPALTGTIATPSSAQFEIGRYNNNSSTRPRDMLEVRLSTSANVTVDYIKTEYENQSSVGAWGTVGTWSDSAGTTPVTRDLTNQWNVLQQLTTDHDTRWAILNAVDIDLQTTWNLLNQITKDEFTSWDILQQLSKDVNISWDIIAALFHITSDMNMRWNIINAVQKDVQTAWQLLNSVIKSQSLSWHLLNAMTKDVQVGWRIQESVERDVAITWDVDSSLTAVTKDIDLRYNILQAITTFFDSQWNLLEAVTQDQDIRFDIANAVVTELGAGWNIVNGVATDLPLRWNSLELMQNSLTLKWSVDGLAITPITFIPVRPEIRQIPVPLENRIIPVRRN